MATTEAQVTVTGTPENPVFNFVLPSGPKGEPGGWNSGTWLLTSNLNDILEPGLYKQDQAVNATLARNYPIAGTPGAGVLEVILQSSATQGTRLQRFTSIWGPTAGKGVYQRTYFGGSWTPWSFVAAQRVDNTAGRAIYTWDDVNNREQLIYGDTGWRDVTSLLSANFVPTASTGKCLMRRMLNTTYLLFRLAPSQTLLDKNQSKATVEVLMNIPSGFTESPASYGLSFTGTVSTPVEIVGIGATNTTSELRVRGSSANTWKSNEIFSANISWPTVDSWPTTLPGTAA